MVDISFNVDEGKFNFRVAAYITCGDKILLERADSVKHVSLIGGRVKLGENTVDAIRREVKEEIGVTLKAQKLMVIAENFFVWQGKNVHEMLFIYHIELPKEYLNLNGTDVLDHPGQHVEWVEKSKIKNLPCKPDLVYKLPQLENEPHVLHSIGNKFCK